MFEDIRRDARAPAILSQLHLAEAIPAAGPDAN